MIEGITYQSKKKFSAGLYALEVKSRFIDQKHADGYYKGFGEELSASATGNVITLGTGAFLVQGRMNIVTESERVIVSAAHAGKKGMLVAHINTFQPDSGEYCVLQTFFDTSVEAIKSRLKHENTYEAEADTSNRVYELPLFAFDIGENGTVSNLVKEIKPIEDYATVKSLYDEILAQYKAHNEEMKKIKDEIVSRQGTIVTSGGQNLLSFDADLKANLTKVSEIEKRLDSLGFKSGNITSTVCDISEKTYLHRQGNYVIGKIFLQVKLDNRFVITDFFDSTVKQCELKNAVFIPVEFVPFDYKKNSFFIGHCNNPGGTAVGINLNQNGENNLIFLLRTEDFEFIKNSNLDMEFHIGYEAAPL